MMLAMVFAVCCCAVRCSGKPSPSRLAMSFVRLPSTGDDRALMASGVVFYLRSSMYIAGSLCACVCSCVSLCVSVVAV